jgi:hypothetical protein
MCGSIRSPFTASLYSDKGKFQSDLSAARNVNMSECALNQNSLQMTLNHRVPGSSLGATTSDFRHLVVILHFDTVVICYSDKAAGFVRSARRHGF